MEPQLIEITERQFDPDDVCQYRHPMKFCKLCGTWMNCKLEGIDADYRRRPDEDDRVYLA